MNMKMNMKMNLKMNLKMNNFSFNIKNIKTFI